MGHCKGKQIIYLCVDLVLVFVPLVTLPFQMSEDLIWAVSKCVASPRGSLAAASRVTATAGSEDAARASNSLESLHEYGLSEFEEWAPPFFPLRSPDTPRNPPPRDPVTYLEELEGREREEEHVQRAEVGGHVRRQASESQESEGEG